MHRNIFRLIFAPSLVLLIFCTTTLVAAANRQIRGTVLDSKDQPIWGATVVLRGSGEAIAATPTDSLGDFRFLLSDSEEFDSLVISAIGYQTLRISLTHQAVLERLSVHLAESTIELRGMSIRASRDRALNSAELSAEQIREASSNSLVPGNPAAALITPQLARIGSNHSSQIRVSGSAPVYYLNGSPIGSDPNHFGAFSVVPGAVVRPCDSCRRGPMSPSVRHRPSISAPCRLRTKLSGSLNLSTIEADAFFKVGNSRFFALGSLRKSTLDKLVNQFDISTNRRTIPPTNFQDIFASAGVRLSPIYQLQIDQYQVRDFLSYNTASAGSEIPSTQTLQATQENYLGIKLHRTSARCICRPRRPIKSSIRQYVAEPQEEVTAGESRIDLSDSSRSILARMQSDFDFGRTRAIAGIELASDTRDRVHLHQINWNLQPPFTCTDNPFIYQFALNETFGHYSGDNRQNQLAGFFSPRPCIGETHARKRSAV